MDWERKLWGCSELCVISKCSSMLSVQRDDKVTPNIKCQIHVFLFWNSFLLSTNNSHTFYQKFTKLKIPDRAFCIILLFSVFIFLSCFRTFKLRIRVERTSCFSLGPGPVFNPLELLLHCTAVFKMMCLNNKEIQSYTLIFGCVVILLQLNWLIYVNITNI